MKQEDVELRAAGQDWGDDDALLVLKRIDYTLSVHGHLDANTPLHQSVKDVIGSGNQRSAPDPLRDLAQAKEVKEARTSLIAAINKHEMARITDEVSSYVNLCEVDVHKAIDALIATVVAISMERRPQLDDRDELRFRLENAERNLADLERGVLEAVQGWTIATPDCYAQRSPLETLQYQLWVAVKQHVLKATEGNLYPSVDRRERVYTQADIDRMEVRAKEISALLGIPEDRRERVIAPQLDSQEEDSGGTSLTVVEAISGEVRAEQLSHAEILHEIRTTMLDYYADGLAELVVSDERLRALDVAIVAFRAGCVVVGVPLEPIGSGTLSSERHSVERAGAQRDPSDSQVGVIAPGEQEQEKDHGAGLIHQTIPDVVGTEPRPRCENTKTCTEPCEDVDGLQYCLKCGLWDGAK